MSKTLLLAMSLLLVLTTSLQAQTEHPTVEHDPHNTAVPNEGGLSPLLSLVGTWTIHARFTPDSGTTWVESTTESTITSLLGGRFVHESFVLPFPNGQSMHIECTRAYDNFQHLYRAVCLDNVMGLMDIYEGNWHEQKLTLSNVRPDTYFLAGPEGEVKIHSRQLIYNLTTESFQVDWEATHDQGKTWSPAGQFTYRRQTPPSSAPSSQPQP